MKPSFKFEKPLWKKGYLVIGVDEVGRGAIAGPVVASAVAFATNSEQRTKDPSTTLGTSLEQIGIDDSKRLTAKRREVLAKVIKKRALAYGIGETGVGTINSIGIKKATERAMRRAIKNVQFKMYNLQLRRKKIYILLDGYYVKYLPGGMKNQKAIVKGDQKSISIAAASIIAKLYRDHKMRLLDKKYPHYQFGQHKGYGTKKHKDAILKFGETIYHRQKFVITFLRTFDSTSTSSV